MTRKEEKTKENEEDLLILQKRKVSLLWQF